MTKLSHWVPLWCLGVSGQGSGTARGPHKIINHVVSHRGAAGGGRLSQPPLFSYMEIKFTRHKTNHFGAYNPVAFSAFTMLQPPSLSGSKIFPSPGRETHPQEQWVPPPPPALQTLTALSMDLPRLDSHMKGVLRGDRWVWPLSLHITAYCR